MPEARQARSGRPGARGGLPASVIAKVMELGFLLTVVRTPLPRLHAAHLVQRSRLHRQHRLAEGRRKTVSKSQRPRARRTSTSRPSAFGVGPRDRSRRHRPFRPPLLGAHNAPGEGIGTKGRQAAADRQGGRQKQTADKALRTDKPDTDKGRRQTDTQIATSDRHADKALRDRQT